MENMKRVDWFLLIIFVANLCASIPLGSLPNILGWSCAAMVQLRICLTK
jgi:hypothetical protein